MMTSLLAKVLKLEMANLVKNTNKILFDKYTVGKYRYYITYKSKIYNRKIMTILAKSNYALNLTAKNRIC